MSVTNVKNFSKNWARLAGTALLTVLVLYGVLARTKAPEGPLTPPTKISWQTAPGLKVRADLSQTRVLKGGDGTVYMAIDLEADKLPATGRDRKPTDFIVVLDRSGSMMDQGKMNYAHRAIESLLRQMSPKDRFALVSFDDIAELPVPLTAVSSDNLNALIANVRAITPRGGTNLGAGLVDGVKLAKSAAPFGSARRLILLSDGLANVGVVDQNELDKIASQAVPGEFVVSTIGLGLDFNERLLSSLADHGTGNYHFLESTAALDAVLSKEFYGASAVVASGLELTLDLAPGIKVTDVSGYPFETNGGQVTIRPGHLYQGQSRKLFVTLDLPTSAIYSEDLGKARLSYKFGGKDQSVALLPKGLNVACVPEEMKSTVTASINKPVYDEAWTTNNFGRTLQESSAAVSSGDKDGAIAKIEDYAKKLRNAYDQAPSPALQQKIAEADDEKEKIEEAFESPNSPTEIKRLSKTQQATGSGFQRGQKTK